MHDCLTAVTIRKLFAVTLGTSGKWLALATLPGRANNKLSPLGGEMHQIERRAPARLFHSLSIS